MNRTVSRFDHAVIAVADLDAAIDVYRGLGFVAAVGGKHTGRGTHNAIIRFGLDYLELISVYDHRLAETADGNVADLVEYLELTGGGLLGYALAATDLERLTATWTADFAPPFGPVEMERIRPDGTRLNWNLLIPGGSAWRRPWPFLIEWRTPDLERLTHDGTGKHPNGANGVASVTVVAKSVPRVLPLYVRDLGLVEQSRPGGAGARFNLGSFRIELIDQGGFSPEAAAFLRDGEGLFEVELTVSDLAAAAALLAFEPGVDGRLVIPPERACGARLVLIAGP